MNLLDLLAVVLACGLFGYLLLAMLRPEMFS